MAALELTREQVLAHRRRANGLEERVAPTPDSVRRAAWAGMTDSVPRAALHSLHARVEGTPATAVPEPPLVQVWGQRFSVHVIEQRDRAVFTLARRPMDTARYAEAELLAERLDAHLAGAERLLRDVARELGVHHHQFRYASTTGRLLIRWDGARQPTVRTAPLAETDYVAARLELLRRYLHVLGPGTVAGFGDWAGLRKPSATAAFDGLADELVPVRTDLGDAWALARDEPSLRAPVEPSTAVRLLPSGDAYYLLWDRERERLVPDAARRAELWTPRVWPGAVLVRGEVVGTWRRADEKVVITPWQPLDAATTAEVEHEATSLPLPGVTTPISVRWAS
ncbi:DNA glycosylase AlkZ-like family protein [Actinotalea solisilvae]|uniref:DNA glycosylase AlkZ-like family protein n=1 Tax=Actinotalea solisilvae TaxID=2072922 RepID=UPI0018F256CC|nr:crosslink repair DNA glycosylase YcaQ family protein [Actinotalea solisilvae]